MSVFDSYYVHMCMLYHIDFQIQKKSHFWDFSSDSEGNRTPDSSVRG